MKTPLILALFATLAAAAHSETYAMIVGINDYPDRTDQAGNPLVDENGKPVSAKLRGCVNDSKNAFAFVTEKAAVKKENVVMLLDADATKDKFLAGIRGQLSKLKPGDEFLFFFSGHGSRIPDKESKDADGKGSAIVLRDYVLVRGNVFGELAKGLAGSGIKSTFLFDSCFAGGMSRDTNIYGFEGARKKTLDASQLGKRAIVVPNGDLTKLTAGKPKAVEAAPYAFIYASQKDVPSIDFPGNPAKDIAPQGLFSFALWGVLNEQPNVPIGDVVDAIAEMFEKVFAGKDIKQRPEDEFSSAERAKMPLVLGG